MTANHEPSSVDMSEVRVNRVERRAIAVLLGITLTGMTGLSRAQEESATGFASLTYGQECDAKNHRLILVNAHTYKSLQVTVRWHAAGGKDLQEQFLPAPETRIEIGCAADAQIVEAKFADF